MNTDDRALADQIAFTSKLLEKEIEKTGTMESFMIRAGLLRSILAVTADRLEAFHAKAVVGEEQLEAAARIIDPSAFDENVVSYRNWEHRDECQWRAIEKARTLLAALQSPPPVVSGEAK